MRQLGTLADEGEARRFEDYLLTRGIPVLVEPGEGGYRVWVRHEDHVDDARREFGAFKAEPEAAVYRAAQQAADSLRADEQRRAREARKNLVEVRPQAAPGLVRRAPVTALLAGACIVAALVTNFGKTEESVTWLSIDYYRVIKLPPSGREEARLQRAWMRQPWRMVTPIFLHFNILHLLFNVLMLVQLGRPIESRRGSWKFAALVVVMAAASNMAQYAWNLNVSPGNAPGFGGMSGVVYGLFGYIWMKSRYEPSIGFVMPTNIVVWMIAWFVLCLVGIIPNVANVVHGVGLAVGMLIGGGRTLLRTLR
jgi:GlpG protein